MAERFGTPPGITQGDMGPRYTRKRLGDEVYVGHYIKAGDRIRVRSTILTGVIASLTTVNLTIGGRVQGMDGDLVPFGDSFTLTADGVQTAQYVMAPEGYVVDLIVQSTSTGLTSGDLTVIVDIVQGTGSNAVAVGLLAYGYVYPAGLLGLNVSRNIGGGSGGGMAIGGTVTSGTAGSVLFVGAGPVLAQDNTHLFWNATTKEFGIGTGGVSGDSNVLTLNGDASNAGILVMRNPYDVMPGAPYLLFDTFNTSVAAPSASVLNDILGQIYFSGYSTVPARTFATKLQAQVSVVAAGVPRNTFTIANDDAGGTAHVKLSVTPLGSADMAALDANTSVGIAGQLEVQSSVVLHKGVTFANLPASPVAGMVAYITDSNAFLWGATIAGGSTNKVLGFYNGTNWTVAGA